MNDMRFILKSLLFIALAAYFLPKGNDDSFIKEAGGAMASVFQSFTKDSQPKPQGRNTLNADDLNPPWQGRVKRL